jgi:hypothetical protein
MPSALPLTLATRPLPKIENWPLRICHLQLSAASPTEQLPIQNLALAIEIPFPNSQ